MSKLLKNLLHKKIEYTILCLSIIFFSLPILIYGSNDYETYYWGFFSNSLYYENFFSPLKKLGDEGLI